MKKTLVFLLILILGTAKAQHCSNNINTITTDWRSPLSTNTWDWTALQYDVYLANRTPSFRQRVISLSTPLKF